MDLKKKYTQETGEKPYCWTKSGMYVKSGSYSDGYVKWLEKQLLIIEDDYFQHLPDVPKKIKDIVDNHPENDYSYENQKSLIDSLEENGWTCSFGLDGSRYDLQPLD